MFRGSVHRLGVYPCPTPLGARGHGGNATPHTDESPSEALFLSRSAGSFVDAFASSLRLRLFSSTGSTAAPVEDDRFSVTPAIVSDLRFFRTYHAAAPSSPSTTTPARVAPTMTPGCTS